MTRVEMKCLLAKVNGKQFKLERDTNDGGRAVIDVFALANLKSGVVVKPLDPDECEAKGITKCVDYPFSDPRYCECYSKFDVEGKGYDNSFEDTREDVANTARRILALDPDKPTTFGHLIPGISGGNSTCPMF
jgi:hypothetical protein